LDFMYQKYTGIILKKHPFGEADELLTVYTREAGKIRCKAVSNRKPTSKLAGHLQSLNEIEFEVASAAARRGGGPLPVLISVRALSINSYLRQNLRKFAFALVGIETLYRLMGDREENGPAYDELRNFLKNLGESADENLAVREFQLGLLAASGYAFPGIGVIASGSNSIASLRGNPKQSLNNKKEIASPFEYKGLAMTKELENEIDRFIDYVLEREIKSAKMLDSLI